MVKSITVIAQARFNASRLPGKVMLKLKGQTVLAHIIARVRKCKNLSGENSLIIATSDNEHDDIIAYEAQKNKAAVFRGSEEDVLSRFYGAAEAFNARHILRLCCDNPFTDSDVIDAAIDFYNKNDFDYINSKNTAIGIGLEIFRFENLKTAYRNASKAYQREHVTPYIREHSDNKGVYIHEEDYSKYRLTLDTPEDWRLINEIYDRLYREDGSSFRLKDVIELLEHENELFEINAGVVQRKAE